MTTPIAALLVILLAVDLMAIAIAARTADWRRCSSCHRCAQGEHCDVCCDAWEPPF